MSPNSNNNILVNSKILLDIFPFHFIFDSNLIVRQAGSSIKHLLGLEEGDLVSDYFELKTPKCPLTASAIKENLTHLFILMAKKNGLVFRGQVVLLDKNSVFAFLGSPVLKTQEDLKKLDLNPSHFPLHDSLLDFLVLFQSHKISLSEAKSVTERLLKSHNELKAAKSDLEDYSKRFKAVLDNVIDGIITIDKRGLIEFFSESAGHIFGYQAHEVIGKNVKILMPEPYRNERDSYIKNYIQTEIPKIVGLIRELKGLRKDGSIFPM